MMFNIKKYLRVIQVARKPGKEEFSATAKVCLIGIIIIGLIGFVIFVGGALLGI